jgi:hypothetical protein
MTQDPDRCTEILEDGTIYTFSITKSAQLAQQALDGLYELEGQEVDFDYTSAVFTLFIDSIQTLTDSGWTTEELINEVITHSQAKDADQFRD